MEPFGLLNFLQTLLNNNAFSQNVTQKSVENKENSTFSPPDEYAATSQNTEKKLPQTEETSPMQNTFAQFLENHDARVKNTKKH